MFRGVPLGQVRSGEYLLHLSRILYIGGSVRYFPNELIAMKNTPPSSRSPLKDLAPCALAVICAQPILSPVRPRRTFTRSRFSEIYQISFATGFLYRDFLDIWRVLAHATTTSNNSSARTNFSHEVLYSHSPTTASRHRQKSETGRSTLAWVYTTCNQNGYSIGFSYVFVYTHLDFVIVLFWCWSYIVYISLHCVIFLINNMYMRLKVNFYIYFAK